MRSLRSINGFALPTVLITSVTMMILLLATLNSMSSVSVGINNQYYDKLASEAAQSGIAMAKACINSGTTNWSNPLRPGGNCDGLADQCTGSACYVMQNSNIHTSFSVPPPTINGDRISIDVESKVSLTRSSNGLVWKSYTKSMKSNLSDNRVSWTDLGVSAYTTCAIGSDTQAYCTGGGTANGNGTGSSQNTFNPIVKGAMPSTLGVREISTRGTSFHSCLVAVNNQAYCWGDNNSNGQLGNGTTTASTSPVAVSTAGALAGKTIKKIAVGSNHTCAIASDNKAYCWGANDSGEVGNGTISSVVSSPVAVSQGAIPAGATIRELSLGLGRSCAIASDNKAYCWGWAGNGGDNYHLGNGSSSSSSTPVAVSQGSIPTGLGVISISASNYHTCVIASNNQAYCWGTNDYGHLGNGTTTPSPTPAPVSTSGALSGKSIREIEAGGWTTCVIASDNNSYCWGTNSNGILGNGTTNNSTTPVLVSQGAMPSGSSAIKIANAAGTACLVNSVRDIYCRGSNGGRYGNGPAVSSLTLVRSNLVFNRESPSTTIQAASGNYFTCWISSNWKAYCSGSNYYGSLGNGTTTNSSTPSPVVLGTMPSNGIVREITAGDNHACAIASDNKAYCWGFNEAGQLGNGTTTNSSVPVAVSQGAMPSGAKVRKIVAMESGVGGAARTCAIASDNEMYCWGGNELGQFGNGTTTNSSVPVAVSQGAMPSGSLVRDITGGFTHTCAIASDNKEYCWGSNGAGQLGNGTTTSSSVPVAVSQGAMPSGSLVRQISAGYSSSCAIAADNKMYCRGYNYYGQLGNGTTTNSSVPVAVSQGAMPSGSLVRDIGVDWSSHACAIASDNKAYCWGANGSGQLGNNTTEHSSVPVAVSQGAMPSGTTMQKLGGNRGSFSCGIVSNSQLYCWGLNISGGFGNGSTSSSYTPSAAAIFPAKRADIFY